MPGFTTSIVLAGVLIFLGGLIALGAQKARQMGAPLIISTTASWTAAIALAGALLIGFLGISSLNEPGEKAASPAHDLDRVLG